MRCCGNDIIIGDAHIDAADVLPRALCPTHQQASPLFVCLCLFSIFIYPTIQLLPRLWLPQVQVLPALAHQQQGAAPAGNERRME